MLFTTKLTMEQCYEELSSSVKLRLLKGKVKCVRNGKGEIEVIKFSDKGHDSEFSLRRKKEPFWIRIHGVITPSEEEVEVMLHVKYGFTFLENILMILVGIVVLFLLRGFYDNVRPFYLMFPIAILVGSGSSYMPSLFSERANAKEREIINYIIDRLQLYQIE